MKKLFSLATALILLAATTSQTFAADIVVRTVKIKKRNVSSSHHNNVDRLYHFWADCWEYDLTTTTNPGTKEDQTIFAFATTFSPDKGKTMSTATIEITVMDCNLKSTTKTLTLKPNKEGSYEGSITLPSAKGCALTLTAADIYATSSDGEVAAFESELDKTTGPAKDCKGTTNLKNIDFATENASGFYVMSFSMQFEKEMPAATTMLAQVTDCKGTKATVQVKLAYDPTTGLAMGSTGIAQNKDCPWTLTYGEVYSIDPCGTESTWAVDFGAIKNNDTGTRSGANTVKASKPTLK